MNKENKNIITHKVGSPWRSPKIAKKQEKCKEQYLTPEKRGLQVKLLNDNNIIIDSKELKLKKSFIKTKDEIIQVNIQNSNILNINKEIENKIENKNNIKNAQEVTLNNNTTNTSNLELVDRIKKLEKQMSELENSKNITILALEQDLHNRDQFIEQLQKQIQILGNKKDSESPVETEKEIINDSTQLNNNNDDDIQQLKEKLKEIEDENKELKEDLQSYQEVVESLEERENWIPQEDFDERVAEEVEKQMNSIKSKSQISTTLIDTKSNKEIEDEKDKETIKKLQQKVETLTLNVEEKEEQLKKVKSENHELYDEIKEYQEVISLLEDREHWMPPEEVEKLKGELYQVVIEKGFLETELQETKQLLESVQIQQ